MLQKESTVARLLEGDPREAHDDVGLDRPPRDTAGHLEGPFGLEELTAIGVDETDLEIVGALVGEIGADAEDEDHGGMPEG